MLKWMNPNLAVFIALSNQYTVPRSSLRRPFAGRREYTVRGSSLGPEEPLPRRNMNSVTISAVRQSYETADVELYFQTLSSTLSKEPNRAIGSISNQLVPLSRLLYRVGMIEYPP